MKKYLCVLALLALLTAAAGCSAGAGAARTVVRDADLVIAKNDVSATAQYYPVEVDGTALEVLAVRAPDGSIRTAFNTCQVCFASGRGYYKQQGDTLVCQNCGNRFKMNMVEVASGGCNPVPIFDEYTVQTDDTITVPLDLLQKAKGIFANWKTAY